MDQSTVTQCKNILLSKREELTKLNNTFASYIRGIDKAGDEIDQTNSIINEHKNIILQKKNTSLLIEINLALEKIKNNDYGFCEHTGLKISEARLLVIPWTRLSVEGAETIEQIRKRFKQHRLT